MGSDDVVTVTEAAALLGITGTAIRELITRGRLVARRIGPMYVIKLDDVRDYQRERATRRQPGPPPRRREPDAGNQSAAA